MVFILADPGFPFDREIFEWEVSVTRLALS